MRRFKKSSHAGRLFCLLLILCGVFFVFDASGHSLLAPASKVIADIFAPLYHLTADDTAHDQDCDVSDLSGQLYRRIEQLEIQIAALAPLTSLMDLKHTYYDYHSTGAVVIGSDFDGWYDTYIIDKGSSDGITVDMNVLAGGGLAGIITETSQHTAKVRPITDEGSSISCMLLKSQDLCIAQGDIRFQSSGRLRLTMLGQSCEVSSGDEIVTSYISSQYMPNLPVGYITSVNTDSHGNAQSGEIIPAADFDHLTHVLVITDLKSGLVKGEDSGNALQQSAS